MGSVFRARHVKLPRWFAIKVLHPRLVDNAKVRRRFEREAELAGRLAHKNVVGVVDFGEVDGISYLVMELAPGRPMCELLCAPFAHDRAVNLIGQILDGLDHAHTRGLVHRDLKPENVMVENVDGTEVARIVDFGIAVLHEADGERKDRLTTNGLVLGTPQYMAPEVATARAFDHRADLFAVGVMSYELLTGRLPFDGDGVTVVHANVHDATPSMRTRAPGAFVEPALEAFTHALMAKQPHHRPASAAAARALLARADQVRTPRPRVAVGMRPLTPPDPIALGSAQTQALATLELDTQDSE